MSKQGVATQEVVERAPKRRLSAAEKAQAEIERLRSERRVKAKGSYRHLADENWFEDQERVKEHMINTLELVMQVQGLTQEDIARTMGCSPAAVRHRLYGRTVIPATEIAALARRLGVEVNIFLDPDMKPDYLLQKVKGSTK